MSLSPSQKPVSWQNDRWQRELAEVWAIEVQPPGHPPHRVAIPAGTWYNPSAPGVSAALVSMSRMEVASALHDPLYRLQGNVGHLMQRLHHEGTSAETWGPVETIGRRFADELFVHLMRRQGVEAWKVRYAWLGIRSPFGWWAWREEDEPGVALHRARETEGWCEPYFRSQGATRP